jgi:hypothetical protein
VNIPVACTLGPGDAASQLGEWRDMLRQMVAGSERVSPHRLELELRADADMASVVSLAQREVACCAFFSFTIEIAAQRLVLAVEVPDDAVETLDQLVSGTSV